MIGEPRPRPPGRGPRVLVTDGETRAALAAVRSLGRAGYDVSVAATRLPSLASTSRFARQSVSLPAPSEDPGGAAARLATVAEAWRIEVVLPVTDATMGAVLRHLGPRVGSAVVAGPSLEAYEAIADKSALLDRAARAGCPTPRTALARGPSELADAMETVGFPCVLKPNRSVVAVPDGVRNPGVRYVATARGVVPDYPATVYPILVQERVVGPGEGVFLLMDRGQRVAAFAHRRLREKPPAGGVSTYRESIALPADLLCTAERLLADLDWHGAAMVEFKRCARTARGILMEVNGRLWGSLQLAIDAGVDFPVLAASLARGEPVEPVEVYRVGVRSRWWWGDVDHLVARLRHSPTWLGLPPGAPSRWQTVCDFLHVWRSADRLEVWDADDPLPFLRETIDWFRGRSA